MIIVKLILRHIGIVEIKIIVDFYIDSFTCIGRVVGQDTRPNYAVSQRV